MVKITNKFLDEMYQKYSIDSSIITRGVLRKAINVELEHGSRFGVNTDVIHDNPELALRIALAHMLELGPGYYKSLDQMEKRLKKNKTNLDLAKRLRESAQKKVKE
jgi:hypothetical protein